MEQDTKTKLEDINMLNLNLQNKVKIYQDENDNLKDSVTALEEKYDQLLQEHNQHQINEKRDNIELKTVYQDNYDI